MLEPTHANAVPLVEVWRGPFLESQHCGHAVICDRDGAIVDSWGVPDITILPRSSIKMIQALPLVTSGAADALSTRRLALACASHQGAHIHTEEVRSWLIDLGLDESALRCGPQFPGDRGARAELIKADKSPCQVHNNCSGKHCGFLMLNHHLGGGPEYIDVAHPVQRAVLESFEKVTSETSPGHAVDGCSAPNFSCSLYGLARAMAWFAGSDGRNDNESRAATKITLAMLAHPELVAGEGRACTELMRAMDGVVVKTGAEGVFTAILPKKRLGIALKIADGATRASEALIAQLLIRCGVLDPQHPAARRRVNTPILSRAGLEAGLIQCVESLR